MKKFLLKLTLFLLIIALVFVLGIILPPTPRASKSNLFSKINKDSLLQKVKSPRIIFVGGSNLSFGLNSKMIKDSLNINPINTGIHVRLGLMYMMDSTLPYIQSGDIVVVSPEYVHFFREAAYGGEELLRIVLDVSPSEWNRLRKEQWLHIISYIPKYSLSKFKLTEYVNVKENNIYGVNSFNEFGDVYTHWKLEKQIILPFGPSSAQPNYSVINELRIFREKLKKRGAFLFITFPGYQSTSFENQRASIMMVEAELKNSKFCLLGTPERYKMPDSLMFNTPYHLSKIGVDYRTQLLIEDLKKAGVNKKSNSQKDASSDCR
jgi:hypothetical protein